jgi:hypothetical protein
LHLAEVSAVEMAVGLVGRVGELVAGSERTASYGAGVVTEGMQDGWKSVHEMRREVDCRYR